MISEADLGLKKSIREANIAIVKWVEFWYGTRAAPRTLAETCAILNLQYTKWCAVMLGHYQLNSGLNAALQTAGVAVGQFADDARIPRDLSNPDEPVRFYGVPTFLPAGVSNNGTAFTYTAPV